MASGWAQSRKVELTTASATDQSGIRDSIGAVGQADTSGLHNYLNATYSNQNDPSVFVVGDSMVGTPAVTFRESFGNKLPIKGYGLLTGTMSGAASVEYDACVKWISGQTWKLSASGDRVSFDIDNNAPVAGDTLKVYYTIQSGGGAFSIESQENGGSWTTEAASVSTAGASLASGVYTITKTQKNSVWRVRCSWVSGTVNIIGAGIRDSTKRGALLTQCYNQSTLINNIDNASATSQAVITPVLADLAPNLCILSHLDGATIVNSYQATFQNKIAIGAGTTPSWIVIGPPCGYDATADAARKAQADAQKALAISRGEAFFDNRTWALPSSNAIARGYLTSGDQVHYQTPAILTWISKFWEQFPIDKGLALGNGKFASVTLQNGPEIRAQRGATSTGRVAEIAGGFSLVNPPGETGKNIFYLDPYDTVTRATSYDYMGLRYASGGIIQMWTGGVVSNPWNWDTSIGGYQVYVTGSTAASPLGTLGRSSQPMKSLTLGGNTFDGSASTSYTSISQPLRSPNQTSGVAPNTLDYPTIAQTDVRYRRVYRLTSTGTQTVSGTTLTAASQLTQVLPAGMYEVTVSLKISADTTYTNGVRTATAFSGTYSSLCGLAIWGFNAATTPGEIVGNISSIPAMSAPGTGAGTIGSNYITISGGSACVMYRYTFRAVTSGTWSAYFCSNAGSGSATLQPDCTVTIAEQ